MDYVKIERKFVDYILNILGPSEECDKVMHTKYLFVKSIITNHFLSEQPNLKPHFFCFGSYPLKTYLQDSDLDITIIFQELHTGDYLTNNSFDFLNKILTCIQTCFDSHNIERKCEIFSDINLIFADIKLIKCKYENLSIDISINNVVGLSKLVLFNSIEANISSFFQPNFLKRSLILIKAWCYYEGGILGSNNSLMANYALEVLVLFVFNKYHSTFENEFDAFTTFASVVSKIDWNSEIIDVFGIIPIEEYQSKLVDESQITSEPFWYHIENENENSALSLIPISEISKLAKELVKIKEVDKQQNYSTNKKNLTLKHINIIDPLFNNNNLGKSINLHNFSKIQKVFEFLNNDLQVIFQSRQGENSYDHLNNLSKLFSKSLTAQSTEIFYYFLMQPKIVIDPHMKSDDQNLCKTSKNSQDKVNYLLSVNEMMVSNLKEYFKLPENCSKKENIKESDSNKLTNITNSYSCDLVTKELLDFMVSEYESNYNYSNFYSNSEVEEFIKKLEL